MKLSGRTICIAIGIEATNKTTEKAIASRKSSPGRDNKYIKHIPTRMMENIINSRVIRIKTFWKFETSSTEEIISAVFPKNLVKGKKSVTRKASKSAGSIISSQEGVQISLYLHFEFLT